MMMYDVSQETGARVDVFPLCCPLSTDRVVRVCGMPVSVSRCIFGLHTLLKQVCPLVSSSGPISRVIACLENVENLEMSGNLTVVREMSGISLKVMKVGL